MDRCIVQSDAACAARRPSPAAWAPALVLCAGLLTSACDKDTVTPATPAPTPAGPVSVTVAVAAGGTAEFLALTQAKQFLATALASDGTKEDATNKATWQSSDTTIALVSPAGVVTAAGFGTATIKATVSGVAGQLAVMMKDGCLVTLDPPSLVYAAAYNSVQSVNVMVFPTDCRWRAESDAAWLPLKVIPLLSGSGSFSYSLTQNTSPAERVARIVVTASDGSQAVHALRQEQPTCALALSPVAQTFPRNGGKGSFTVTATPSDCQWTAAIEYDWYASSARIDKGGTGKGTGTVEFTAYPNNRGYTFSVPVIVQAGPATNPPARFTITLGY